MEKQLIRAETRGHTNYRWLKAKHYFSFGNYFDLSRMGVGTLRVINDDIIGASGGFGTHPHDNMEIITIPLSGALKHRDSMGHESVLGADEVQVMSAGSGITHSEFNHSEQSDLSLFQIWILPQVDNIVPRYDQKIFSRSERSGQLQLLVSPNGEAGSLAINQDAFISRIELEKDKIFEYRNKKVGHIIFALLIEGQIEVEEESLQKRDAIALSADVMTLSTREKSDILFIEISDLNQ